MHFIFMKLDSKIDDKKINSWKCLKYIVVPFSTDFTYSLGW